MEKSLSRKLTTEEFIEKARKTHGDRFCYDKVVYSGAAGKIIIGCPVHGDVLISADAHGNQGQGCGKCRGHSIHLGKRFTKDQFLTNARKVHGSKYDYSSAEYVNNATKVCIICREHGPYWQSPNCHVNAGHGCPSCMESGFRVDKPASLYVLSYVNWTKVGVTNRAVSARAKEINKYSGFKFDELASFSFDVGAKALAVETQVLNQLRQEYSNPVEIFNGSTETFVDLSPEVVIKKIAEAIQINLPQSQKE